MSVFTSSFNVKTEKGFDIVNLSEQINLYLENMNFPEALVNVSVIGATAAITTMEYEPGLIIDLDFILERLVPSRKSYTHNKKWETQNANAFLLAAIFGNSRAFVFYKNELKISSSQQIVLLDFDDKPRVRKILVQIVY